MNRDVPGGSITAVNGLVDHFLGSLCINCAPYLIRRAAEALATMGVPAPEAE